MKRRVIAIGAAVLVLGIVFVGGWMSAYPSQNDPKNIRYVFWKAGFHAMDLDTAAWTMIGDADRDRIVIGRTKSELRNRFGQLLTPADATPYLRGCYLLYWKGEDALFIRTSPWLIIFEDDRATDLVLIKGC